MRLRATLRLGALSLLLGLGALPVRGQGPGPAEIAAGPLLRERQTIVLVVPWRFRAGDDPAWASRGFDDSGWESVAPAGSAPGGAPEDAGRVVWFRRHLRLDPRLLGRDLAFTIRSQAPVTVYVDGVSFGPFAPSPPADAAVPAPVRRSVSFFVPSGSVDHVIAVRYDGAGRIRGAPADAPRFFLLTLEGPGAALAHASLQVRLTEAVAVATTTIPVLLAFLHLALYWFDRRTRENLFYACSMLGFAVIIFGGSTAPVLLPEETVSQLGRYTPIGAFAAILFGLLTYYAARTSTFPKVWVPFAAAGTALAAASSLFPGPLWSWLWFPYFVAMMLEVVRVERSGRTVEREGGSPLLWGFIALAVFASLQFLIDLGLVAPPLGYRNVYVLGMIALAVGMSLSLARTMARTSLHLERRLAEVQTLSAQVLEQERTAHRRELEQQLLVAENERKSRELEDARSLQLSMLPAEVPAVAGLDVAVAVSTATEVGGDYYDFRSDGDGGIVLAVGDATGHGAAAGTMVAAVKALFSSLGTAAGLPAAMREYDRVLRTLSFERMHMCLALARIAPRGVAVCTAGMPPVKIRRAASSGVEELGEGGLPLGGNLSPVYSEQRAALAPGDALLFATDGLAELADPEGRAFGDERIAEALRGAGDRPAAEIVALLGEAAAAWRGERPQVDDITVLVVRVTG